MPPAGVPEPLVTVRGLTVRFPRRDVASPVDVDLDVAAGERVLVLGPSGSGKSTLLRALAGVVPHSVDADVEGRVAVAGREVSGVPVARLADDVGLLGQDPASSVALPRVDDEVAFGLENAAVPPGEIGPAVRESLASVGAAHLAGRQTRTLSGGELQRVALAAVLARRPRLLLLDEPTAMLDPASAAAVQRLTLGALPSGGGPPPAVLVVDHHLQDAATLPPRVVVLDAAGRVAADGPTASVLADRGAELAAGGSWVPLETEVALAVGAAPGSGIGLDGAAPRLRALACADRGPRPSASGPVRLRARDAAFRAGPQRGAPVLVRDVDLDLNAGTVTALIGANGSGKTSLLLGLAGLLPRAAGTVDAEAGAGMVFQFPERQFLTRSVAAEVGYGLCGRPDADARVAATLRRFDLEPLAGADPFRLSGGQQRRLSIAAVAALEPGVLLLDEPTFGQDRAHALSVGDSLVELAAGGAAVAFSTHDLRLAGLVADRVVVVRGGRVAASGPTEEVLRDGALLRSAGLRRPRLLDWWAAQDGVPLRGLLTALRRGVAAEVSVA